jgi:hypothetical protein
MSLPEAHSVYRKLLSFIVYSYYLMTKAGCGDGKMDLYSQGTQFEPQLLWLVLWFSSVLSFKFSRQCNVQWLPPTKSDPFTSLNFY